jgi:ribosomal protein S18 acetylase RimI-like enzyme
VAADEEGRLLGAVHAIVPPVAIRRYASLAGRGYIFGPFVRQEARGRGLGRALLAKAEELLAAECEMAFIHGLRAPFYHAREGPRQPFCGSTEIIGLNADDVALLDFLRRAGYQARAEPEVSMVAPLRPAEHASPRDVPDDLRLVRIAPQEVWPGPAPRLPEYAEPYEYEGGGEFTHDSLALVQGDRLVGQCVWYPMRRPGRAALWHLWIDPELRGRGLGRLVLESALAAITEAGYCEVELHTSPQRNDVAYALYHSKGFQEITRWIIMEKRL